MQQEPSFAEIAVSLALAMPTLRLAMARTEVIGQRIGISSMGIDVALEALRRDQSNVERALELLKELAEAEPEIRALLARKRNGRWFTRLTKAVAI